MQAIKKGQYICQVLYQGFLYWPLDEKDFFSPFLMKVFIVKPLDKEDFDWEPFAKLKEDYNLGT